MRVREIDRGGAAVPIESIKEVVLTDIKAGTLYLVPTPEPTVLTYTVYLSIEHFELGLERGILVVNG